MAKLQHTFYTTGGLDAFDTASLTTKGYLLSSNSVKKHRVMELEAINHRFTDSPGKGQCTLYAGYMTPVLEYHKHHLNEQLLLITNITMV